MTRPLLLLIAGLSVVSGTEPQDLTRLRTDWKRSRERSLEPVDRKYLSALQALKDRLVREKKLQDAVLVEQEMNALAGKEGTWFKTKVSVAQLSVGEWRFDIKEPKPYTTHITLKENGEVLERGVKGPVGRWSLKNEKFLRLDIRQNWNEFDLEYEGVTPTLVETKHDGGTKRKVTLTQVSE